MEALSSSLYLVRTRAGLRLGVSVRVLVGRCERAPPLVEVGGRVLARAHAAHRSDGRGELLARTERGDTHLAKVGGSELDLVVGWATVQAPPPLEP